jgi:carotenoid cleavage dioxygenase
MTTTIRGIRPVATATTRSPARVRLAGANGLTVVGTIPAELDGSLLRAVRDPAWTSSAEGDCTAQAPLLDGGIRLRGGTARWYRQPTPACGRTPTCTWRAARLRSGEEGPAALARPVADPVTGLWHTVATYPGRGHAEHLWLGPDGSRRHTEPFALDGAPLVQTVAMSGRFLIVFDLPVLHRRAAALLGEAFPYAWQEGRPARIGLLERGSARPRWFTIQPCFVFNAVNAYDDGDRVVVDAIRHERAFDGRPRTTPPTLWRWNLDLTDGTVSEGSIADMPQDLHEVDPRVHTRRHRYVFGAAADGEQTTALVRTDLFTGETRAHTLGPARRCEQPVFVPRPGAAEGDGWLITVVHDMARARSEVLVLDAGDLDGAPVATVYLPFRLPPSRHTRWQPGH